MAFGNATIGDLKKFAGGGGGGGTSNYSELSNKPQINGVTLDGNKTSADLNITGGGVNLTDITTAITTGDGVNLTTINALIVVGKDSYNRLYSDIIPAALIENGTKLMTAYSTDASFKTYLVSTFSVVSNVAKITTEGGDLAAVYSI